MLNKCTNNFSLRCILWKVFLSYLIYPLFYWRTWAKYRLTILIFVVQCPLVFMTLTFENISGHIKFLFFKEKNECSLVKRWMCVQTAGCSHMLIDSYCSAIHSLDTTSAFSTPTYTLSFPLTNPIPRCFLSFLQPWVWWPWHFFLYEYQCQYQFIIRDYLCIY